MRDHDSTNPGVAPGEPSVVTDDAEPDEFPSEATRIDPNFLNGAGGGKPQSAPSRPSQSLESLAAARGKPGAAPVRGSSPPKGPSTQKNNLAALQSLSLDGGGGSTRLPPAPRQQGGSKLPWILLLLIGAGYGGDLAWKKYKGTGPSEPTGPAVRTEIVQQTGGTGQTHTAAGYVNARDPVSVGAPTGGLVKEVKVANNDVVQKGQIIVNLDDSAALAELAAVRAEVVEDDRQARQMENLQKLGAVTAIEVSRARSAAAIARARMSGPEARIRLAHVRTFLPGTVLEVLVHPGETVQLNGPVVKLADLHNLNAESDIGEADLPKIHRGQEVDVTSDAFPDKTFKGKVTEIGEQADKTKGTVLVKVGLKVDENTLRPGNSVKCTFLPVQGEKPRTYISRSALVLPSSVLVVGSDRKVTQRTISVGPSQGPQVEVLSGLKSGEQIVSDAASVRDGQILPAPAAP